MNGFAYPLTPAVVDTLEITFVRQNSQNSDLRMEDLLNDLYVMRNRLESFGLLLTENNDAQLQGIGNILHGWSEELQRIEEKYENAEK